MNLPSLEKLEEVEGVEGVEGWGYQIGVYRAKMTCFRI